jgi:hypothetical protein
MYIAIRSSYTYKIGEDFSPIFERKEIKKDGENSKILKNKDS